MKLEIRYFAWVRERIGTDRETIETQASTVAELIEELAASSEAHGFAFSDRAALRAAVDQNLAQPETPLDDAREVAFFPPMTGG